MNFASDNWAGALGSVADAVVRGNVGVAPAYGDDAVSAESALTFGRVFEAAPEVHFVATGTAANALSMAALSRPSGQVVVSDVAHLETSEFAATEFLTGMKLLTVPTVDGRIALADLERTLAGPAGGGPSGPMVALSLTNATESGTVYRPDEIAALAGLAHEAGLAVHLDGARFANAVAATGATPAELTWKAGVDIMSFGATKNGAIGAEAILVFTPGLAPDLKVWRHRTGHVVSKARYIAAQFEACFADDAWLVAARHANQMADRLREGLRGAARLGWQSEANEVFAILPAATAARLRAAGATFYDWPVAGAGSGEVGVRLVTSFATASDEVDRFLALIRT